MKRLFAITMMCVAVATSVAVAQRRVSPVEQSTNRTLTAEEKKLKTKQLKAQGLTILGDSIVPDSIALQSDSLKNKRMQYPLLTSVIVGVNLWDPIMCALGQSYGGIDFSAELSLWNRIHPTIELGVGMANSTPEDMNFTYKGKMALYGKLGVNYNFKFNNSPDYVALAGVRAGYSNFGYDIKDIKINSGYWQQTQTMQILDQRSHALWGEIMLAIRVKLFKNLSAGWAFKYHFIFDYKKNENSDPWYIPGFGSRTSPITGGFSLYYTIPLGKSKNHANHSIKSTHSSDSNKTSDSNGSNSPAIEPPVK